MNTETGTLPADLAVKAYNHALEASEWLFSVFPALAAGGYEKEDLAGDWFEKKSKYLVDFKPISTSGTPDASFKYYVFLGMKRFALTHLYKNPNKGVSFVSLDAICGQGGSRFVDLLADSKCIFDPCIVEEVLKEAETVLVGCSRRKELETVVTDDGQVVPKNLKSILELKVEGWNGAEIAELFGLSRKLISKVLLRSAVQFATAF